MNQRDKDNVEYERSERSVFGKLISVSILPLTSSCYSEIKIE